MNLTTSSGGTAAFLVDGIGDQVGALTDTGTDAFTVTYDPYGTGGVTSGSTSPFWTQNPYGFKTGALTSVYQNGLIRYGNRWYLPTIGAWTQEDTLDAPLDPGNANRYAYAGDDPINASDPTGRESETGEYVGRCLVAGSVGIAVGGVTSGPIGAAAGFAIGCLSGVESEYLESHHEAALGQSVDLIEGAREVYELYDLFDE